MAARRAYKVTFTVFAGDEPSAINISHEVASAIKKMLNYGEMGRGVLVETRLSTTTTADPAFGDTDPELIFGE